MPMPSDITIEAEPLTVTVRAGSVVLGHSRRALALREGNRPTVLYVPREDIDMSRLSPSARSSTCPWKGAASYYSVTTPEGVLADAVWSYEAPKPGVAGIAGHLAFYTDRITVERG
jgi:uncharacterized protein (DUF427 family)